MAGCKKEGGFMDVIKYGLGYISQIVSASIFPPIEDRIIQIEKRMLKKIYSLLIIGFGGVFLIFSLFFYLKDVLIWSNTLTFFVIGIIIFVIGLLLKVNESNK